MAGARRLWLHKFFVSCTICRHMDTQSFEAFKQKNISEGASARLDAIIDGFESYAKDGTPYCAEIWSGEEFEELLKLLEIETVQGENVVLYHLENTHSGSTRDSEERGEREPFAGEWKLQSVLEAIADMQVWEDRINDYRATLVLRFDESTVIAIGQDCIELSDGNEPESEPIDEYRVKYWVAVLNAEDLDNYGSWKQWQLEFFDVAKYQAEKEAREIERERAEGVTNLSRLKEGDEITVTTKRLERNPHATSVYSRYSQEELDERFVDSFSVVAAGERPICETKSGVRIRIDGGGRWTNRRQNPVQTQDKAITPSWGRIYPNQHLMYAVEESGESYISDQVVESIEVKPAALEL